MFSVKKFVLGVFRRGERFSARRCEPNAYRRAAASHGQAEAHERAKPNANVARDTGRRAPERKALREQLGDGDAALAGEPVLARRWWGGARDIRRFRLRRFFEHRRIMLPSRLINCFGPCADKEIIFRPKAWIDKTATQAKVAQGGLKLANMQKNVTARIPRDATAGLGGQCRACRRREKGEEPASQLPSNRLLPGKPTDQQFASTVAPWRFFFGCPLARNLFM